MPARAHDFGLWLAYRPSENKRFLASGGGGKGLRRPRGVGYAGRASAEDAPRTTVRPGPGGATGRATGGFFFAHAPAALMRMRRAITLVIRRICMLISFLHARPEGRAYCGDCDQFGYRFMPSLVTCRRSSPLRLIVKICSLPARVDVNARWRPFGANAGLSLLPMPLVI